MLGGLLALLSAATFALSNTSARRGVITGTVLQGLMVTVPIGVPLFAVAALAMGSLGAVAAFTPRSALTLCLAGIIHFIWGRYCNYRAIHAIGANLSAPLQQASLLFALVLAIVFLGESLTPLRILGIVLVVLGPAVMLRSRRDGGGRARATPSGFRPRYVEGYTFAVLSATGYGVSPIFVRAALGGADLGTGVAGGLISYTAATLVIVPVLLRGKERRHVLALDPGNARWFVVSGILTCLSQMVRYMALTLAPVAVVAPIQRVGIVFRYLFSWLMNRDHEVFGPWVLAGMAISLTGALALTVSTELVLSLVPLPDFVIGIAHWQWPAR